MRPNEDALVFPIVETLTEKDAGLAVLIVRDAGETVHLAAVGAPVQVSETVPVKPVPGLSWSAY